MNAIARRQSSTPNALWLFILTAALLIAQTLSAAAQSRPDTFACLLYTSPSPRDQRGARMPSSA